MRRWGLVAHLCRYYSLDGPRMRVTSPHRQRSPIGRLLAVLALGIGIALGVSGCPREPDAPEPLMGTPCMQLTDCNPGRACGALKLCVDGFCEQDASLLRPCRDEGQPVPAPDP